jgi:hypothetical protein
MLLTLRLAGCQSVPAVERPSQGVSRKARSRKRNMWVLHGTSVKTLTDVCMHDEPPAALELCPSDGGIAEVIGQLPVCRRSWHDR